MQVDFVENVTTKINCLGKSVYWPYDQLFAQHGGTHSIVIVSEYFKY